MLTQFVDVQIGRPYGYSWEQFDGQLEFDVKDPLVVRINRLGSREPGWLVAVDLLRRGVWRYCGSGSVHVYPRPKSLHRKINITIDGSVKLTLPGRELRKFLREVRSFDELGQKQLAKSLERELLVMLYDGREDSKDSGR